MNTPAISVLMTTYNREKYVGEAIESEWFNGRQMKKSLRLSWKATLQFAFLS